MFDKLLDPRVLEAMRNIGVPTALLGVITYALWCGGEWTGKHVLTPLVDRQVEFMDELSKSSSDNNATLRSIAETLDKIQETETKQQELLEKMENVAPQ